MIDEIDAASFCACSREICGFVSAPSAAASFVATLEALETLETEGGAADDASGCACGAGGVCTEDRGEVGRCKPDMRGAAYAAIAPPSTPGAANLRKRFCSHGLRATIVEIGLAMRSTSCVCGFQYA